MSKFLKILAVGALTIYSVVKIWIWSAPFACGLVNQAFTAYDCSDQEALYHSPLIIIGAFALCICVGGLVMALIDPEYREI